MTDFFMNATVSVQWIAVLIGAGLLGRAVWLCAGIGRLDPDDPIPDLRQLVRLARGLRAGLVGLGFIGAGLAAFFDVRWLVTASIVVGLEELYETTMALALLRHAEAEHRTAKDGTSSSPGVADPLVSAMASA